MVSSLFSIHSRPAQCQDRACPQQCSRGHIVRGLILVRPMPRAIIIVVALFAVTCSPTFGDPPRAHVTATPRLGGRAVARFFLTSPVKINRSHDGVAYRATLMVELSPGEFVPVAEDADGVFYQARNGVHNLRPYSLNNGGIYVSKSSPQRMWVYVGSARVGAKASVEKDKMYLEPGLVRSFYAAPTN